MILFISPSDPENQVFRKIKTYTANQVHIHVFHESDFEEAIVFIFIRRSYFSTTFINHYNNKENI